LNQLRAILAAVILQIKQSRGRNFDPFKYLVPVPGAVVFAWIARQSPDPAVVTYVLVGVPLMAISTAMMFNVGSSLEIEIRGGTIEFALISHTTMLTMLISKSIAQVITSMATALISLATVFAIAHQFLSVAYIGLLPFSLLLALLSIMVTSLFFSPYLFLIRGGGGLFAVYGPFVTVLSGFLFPIATLPKALYIVARALPNSWAMDAIWQSIRGNVSEMQVVLSWGICAAVIMTWFTVTYFMVKLVEKRIRVTGDLARY
jgi:ABC-type uncharacterized transport system permease subunit